MKTRIALAVFLLAAAPAFAQAPSGIEDIRIKSVTIEEPRGMIRGVGLEFDNLAKTAVLKGQVRGTMQPGPAPTPTP